MEKNLKTFKKPVYFVTNEWQAAALSGLSVYWPYICLGLEHETKLCTCCSRI